MKDSFSKILEKKNDKKLKKIILNPQDYQPEFIELAKKEFEKRYIFLNEDEKIKLKENEKGIELESKNLKKDNKNFARFCRSYKENIVNDTSAPQLYSRKHITIFAILFTSFFGGILLGYNLFVLKKIKELILVLISTLAIAGISVGFAMAVINTDSSNGRGPGYFAAGYLFMNKFIIDTFWWNFIGNRIQFRSKSLRIPVFLSFIIIAILIYLFII